MKSIELQAKQRTGTVGSSVRLVFPRFCLAALLALACLFSAQAARAQNTGSVFGTVQDASGAVVPKATVTIADTTQGLTRTVTSNANGEFQLNQLPVGNYILTVAVTSFENRGHHRHQG